MKVKELQELLSKFDPDSEVVIPNTKPNSNYKTYSTTLQAQETDLYLNSWLLWVEEKPLSGFQKKLNVIKIN